MNNRERINAIVETFASISIAFCESDTSWDDIKALVKNLPSTQQIQELASWAEYGLVEDNVINILDEAALISHDLENEPFEKFQSTVRTIHKLWYSR